MRRIVPCTSALACLAAIAWLRPSGLSWDGLAFLLGDRAGRIDYGHALYLPILRTIGWLWDGEERFVEAARLFSVLGAGVAFLILARRSARAGASIAAASSIAALFATSTLLWQESGSIEPSTWTLVALLFAAERAEAYGRAPTLPRCALVTLGFGLALAFHVVSLCALPWLFALALRGEGRPPRSHALLPLAIFAGVLVLAAASGTLGTYGRYWSGFVPTYESGLWSELSYHLRRGGRLLLEGAPVIAVLGIAGAIFLWHRRSRAIADAVALAFPYGIAFLAFGKPLVGLLLPVLLALTGLIGEAAGELESRRPRARACIAVLLLSLGIQLALSVPHSIEGRRTPDLDRARAELLVRHLPEGTLLFAGRLANHVRYFHPGTPIVALPDLWHSAFARDRGADPIQLVEQAVASSEGRCALSSDGAAFLLSLGADPTRLGISMEEALIVPEDATLALFALRRD
jgi:hypothetical protein